MAPEIWSSAVRIFCVILGNFFSLLSPNTLKNGNIKNERKPWRYYHFTQVYHDHLLYCSRYMAHDGCNYYFHFGLWGIFPSTFLQPVNAHKTPYEILQFQQKLLLLQKNDVQAMLLQSERVSKINFPAIWRSKIQKISLWYPPWEHFMEIVI